MRGDAVEIPVTVVVGVLPGPDVDLVQGGSVPPAGLGPWRVHRSPGRCSRLGQASAGLPFPARTRGPPFCILGGPPGHPPAGPYPPASSPPAGLLRVPPGVPPTRRLLRDPPTRRPLLRVPPASSPPRAS